MKNNIPKFPKVIYRSQWNEGSYHSEKLDHTPTIGRDEIVARYELVEIIMRKAELKEERIKP